ncbi:HAD family hydrolase [Sporolactobacillus sp. CPB3-1]|uniref:HAD family hydrolase n=1 Tax=Sporolactobacillus mangiferae TaxID=2940498 RepID=A0ABT0M9F0_9BACL|nr:HAD family hydrolase [Sporolactobacillus mangiferae]MCL1631496.1 HAD family hydrolase [Sporolactobacillus mangiferae]
MNSLQLIRALVFDLDGTLLNTQKRVSERTQQTLMRCFQKGLHLFIATARPPRSVKHVIPSQILQHVSAVYYNGAYCHDHRSGGTLNFTIPTSIATKIIDYICRRNETNTLSIESEDILYALSNAIYEQNRKHMFVPPTLVSQNTLSAIPANKILLIRCSSESRHYIMSFKDQLNIVETDAGELIQVMAKNVSKASAVSALCKRQNISMNQVMAFGDDWNDLDLFKACGISVAMGNAVPGLEKYATTRAGTNDEEGVAAFLERWLSH